MAVIGLDATSISIYGKGISRYQYNLIRYLSQIDKENGYYVFLNKQNICLPLPQQDNFYYIRAPILNRVIWDQFQLPFMIKKYKLDILHTTSDTLPVVGNTNFVLMLFEIPDYRISLLRRCCSNSLYAKISQKYNKQLFGFSLKKAKLIISTSYSSKNDLISRYGVDERKIRVVYPAPDECFCAANDDKVLLDTRKKYSAEAGYILHISSPDPRDNTPAVIRAYKKAQRELKNPKKLIIYGDIGPKKSELDKLIYDFDLGHDIIFTGRLLRDEQSALLALYQAADLYIDPSLYEGFGFQVVEAMSCGIPVITSNMTSLPEIVGDAGILVNPNDIDKLASVLARVLTDSGLRQTMRQKSLERAKFFSWDKTARRTLDIYSQLIK